MEVEAAVVDALQNYLGAVARTISERRRTEIGTELVSRR